MTVEKLIGETASAEAPYEVGMFRPEDAQGIVDLFKEVYGDDYPIKIFYDPDAIIEANSDGRYHSIVARIDSGEVIGVHHLYPSAPSELLCEWGTGLVARRFRNRGVFNKIGRFIADYAAPSLPVVAVFGESVCNHLHTQKMAVGVGFRDMALEVALMPGETYSKETGSPGRVAAALEFRTFKSRPHKIFLPRPYEEELNFIYSRLDDAREFAPSTEKAPDGSQTEGELIEFSSARVARFPITQAGADLGRWLDEMEGKALDNHAEVIQATLKLSCPWSGAAVGVLRERGYFLGGLLPRWFDDDGLLMQRLFCEPNFEAIQLLSAEAHKILGFVKADWKRAQNSGGPN